MTAAELAYLSVGDALEEAEQSQMFGKPCLKIGGKAFASFFEDDMVFKLSGDVHREALKLEGTRLFDPSGKNRPMKEWVQLPFVHSALWPEYARRAMEYVASL